MVRAIIAAVALAVGKNQDKHRRGTGVNRADRFTNLRRQNDSGFRTAICLVLQVSMITSRDFMREAIKRKTILSKRTMNGSPMGPFTHKKVCIIVQMRKASLVKMKRQVKNARKQRMSTLLLLSEYILLVESFDAKANGDS